MYKKLIFTLPLTNKCAYYFVFDIGLWLPLVVKELKISFTTINVRFFHFPYFSKDQVVLQSGHVYRFLSHLDMQWKWNAWLQMPHATLHSSVPPFSCDAWHSMHMSIRWFLQIAQESISPSHFHMVTAFHFLIRNFFLQQAPESIYISIVNVSSQPKNE